MPDREPYGFCDRTGFRWPLRQLREETVQGRKTGMRVGPDVYDDDHPQNWFGKIRVAADPQSLGKDARPDTAIQESRSMFSYNPAGLGNLSLIALVGRVTAGTT